MNIVGKPLLREALTAEYALGTLAGGARRRFERWLRSDAELRALAAAWSERLRPLADPITPIEPPDRVWRGIAGRVYGDARGRGVGAVALPWWERLGLWRATTAAFATIAAIALALAMRGPAADGPTLVRVDPGPAAQSPPTIVASAPKVVEVERLPAAIATLVDPKSGKPVAVVWEERGARAVYVKVAADVAVAPDRALQLWMKPADAPALVSLGVLPADAQVRTARIDASTVAVAAPATLAGVTAFGLSLEPSGGSPKATRVLGVGPVVRLAN